MTTATKPRPTTTKAKATGKAAELMTRSECVTWLQTHGAYTGHSRDSVAELREAVTAERKRQDAKAAGLAVRQQGPTEGEAKVSKAVAKAAGKLAADIVAADPAAVAKAKAPRAPKAEPEASTNVVERIALAKAEHATLKAWAADGSKPPRPATPNLDAIEAEHSGAKPRTKGVKVREPKADTNPRYTEAKARMAAADRFVATTKWDDEQFMAYLRQVRAERPDTSMLAEYEIVRWMEGVAMSKNRFITAWRLLTAELAAA